MLQMLGNTQRKESKMEIHTDAIVFGISIISLIAGFILGRWERKDSYTKTYRHGFNIGKQVGRNER